MHNAASLHGKLVHISCIFLSFSSSFVVWPPLLWITGAHRWSFMTPLPYLQIFHGYSSSLRVSWMTCSSNRPVMVGWCQHILQHRDHPRSLLGCLEMGPQFQSWPMTSLQYQLGGSCSNRAWAAPWSECKLPFEWQDRRPHIPSPLQQFWDCFCQEQGAILQS